LKRTLIFVHRWLGVALCVLFLVWFPSGIGMMYWEYPTVSQRDRLERSAALDPSTVKLSPAEALAILQTDEPPAQIHLNTFDGRPVYRFGRGGEMVYADTGAEQGDVPTDMVHRIAAAWTGQPVSAASVTEVTEVDQWTVQNRLRDLQPLWKYSWPNGEEVYVSGSVGDVVQYTTRSSRLGAYLGPIPHWFYFTPLRKHGPEWNRFVVWSSGVGTISALLGIVVAIWMYSPSKRYRYDGVPTSIPYRGQKRWHMVFGLIFGLGAVTWAFSGMLSMEPFPLQSSRPAVGQQQEEAERRARSIPGSLRGRAAFSTFAQKHPRQVLTELADFKVKDLELTSFGGRSVYIATLADGGTRIVPVDGGPMLMFEPDQIIEVVKEVAGPTLADVRTIDQYDRYYLDRKRERPLPVIRVELNDPDRTRYYINPKTARVIAGYTAGSWMNRWLYHGLHSLDFPWLYNYRPLWDIVVITFMVGGTALCVTSLVLAWRVLGRTLRSLIPDRARESDVSEDLA
jgi:hypothetical protein